jgi:hypothetical protein
MMLSHFRDEAGLVFTLIAMKTEQWTATGSVRKTAQYAHCIGESRASCALDVSVHRPIQYDFGLYQNIPRASH